MSRRIAADPVSQMRKVIADDADGEASGSILARRRSARSSSVHRYLRDSSGRYADRTLTGIGTMPRAAGQSPRCTIGRSSCHTRIPTASAITARIMSRTEILSRPARSTTFELGTRLINPYDNGGSSPRASRSARSLRRPLARLLTMSAVRPRNGTGRSRTVCTRRPGHAAAKSGTPPIDERKSVGCGGNPT